MAENKRKSPQGWPTAARLLGLPLVPGKTVQECRIIGTLNGWEVRVERIADAELHRKSGCIKVRVKQGAVIPWSLEIRTESPFTSLKKVFEGVEIRTGDAAFDATIHVKGDEKEVIAILNEETRKFLLRQLEGHHLEVRNGEVVFWHVGLIIKGDRLESMVRQVMGLALRLTLKGRSIPQALLNNFKTDGNTSTRLRNLFILLKEYPNTIESEQAKRLALDDKDDSVAAKCALFTMEPNQLLLDRFITRVEQADPDTACDVIHYISEFGNETHEDLLIELLGSEDDNVKVAAAEGLGKRGTAMAMPLLFNVVRDRSASRELKTAARNSLSLIRTRLYAASWKEAASQNRLQFSSKDTPSLLGMDTSISTFRLEGKTEAYEVHVENILRDSDGSVDPDTLFHLNSKGQIFDRLWISSIEASILKEKGFFISAMYSDPIYIGDPAFHEKFKIRVVKEKEKWPSSAYTEDELAFLAMNQNARKSLMGLAKGGDEVSVHSGKITCAHKGIPRSSSEMSTMVKDCVNAAKSMAVERTKIIDHLMNNVKKETSALIRLKNLELLLNRYLSGQRAGAADELLKTHLGVIGAILKGGSTGLLFTVDDDTYEVAIRPIAKERDDGRLCLTEVVLRVCGSSRHRIRFFFPRRTSVHESPQSRLFMSSLPVTTGDERFDKTCEIIGEKEECMSVFDEKIRTRFTDGSVLEPDDEVALIADKLTYRVKGWPDDEAGLKSMFDKAAFILRSLKVKMPDSNSSAKKKPYHPI